jgi:LuxR family maltose regulon positive regulatory protein
MESTFPAAEEYGAIAAVNRAVAQVWTGDLAGARADLGPAIARCLRVDLDAPRLNGLGYLGLATVLLGRPAEASVIAEEARTLAEQRGWTSLTQSAIGDLTRALVLLIRGRPTDAEPVLVQASAATNELLVQVAIRIVHSLLNDSLDRPHAAVRYARSARDMIAGRTVPDFVAEWLALAEAKAALASGDPKATLSMLSREGKDGSSPRWWGVTYAVCSARAWLALSDLPRAERALATTRAAAEDPANPVAAVEVWVVTAILADRLHDDTRAVDAVTRAVRIAAPEGIVRPFVVFDRVRVPRLLGRLSGLDATESGFVAELRSAPMESGTAGSTTAGSATAGSGLAVTPQTPEESTPLVEPLTERELAVLKLLPSMQSNLEIAEEMFVSVNTVKVHLKTLYRKLDVPNRRSAVRRSRTLGLLP